MGQRTVELPERTLRWSPRSVCPAFRALGSDDNTVRLWDPDTGQQVGHPLTGHTSAVSAVAVGTAGGRDLIVSGSQDSTVRLWDPNTGSCLAVWDLTAPVSACTFGAEGMLVAATGSALICCDVRPFI